MLGVEPELRVGPELRVEPDRCVEPELRVEPDRWSETIIAVASGSSRASAVDRETVDGLGGLFGHLRATIRARRARAGEDLASVPVDPFRGPSMRSTSSSSSCCWRWRATRPPRA